MAPLRKALFAAVAVCLLIAAQSAPVPSKTKGKGNKGNGKADTPGLTKVTAANAGGLLRGQARAEWARLNASAKKHAEARLDEVRATAV